MRCDAQLADHRQLLSKRTSKPSKLGQTELDFVTSESSPAGQRMQDHKSVHEAVMPFDTMVNTHTDTHADSFRLAILLAQPAELKSKLPGACVSTPLDTNV